MNDVPYPYLLIHQRTAPEVKLVLAEEKLPWILSLIWSLFQVLLSVTLYFSTPIINHTKCMYTMAYDSFCTIHKCEVTLYMKFAATMKPLKCLTLGPHDKIVSAIAYCMQSNYCPLRMLSPVT